MNDFIKGDTLLIKDLTDELNRLQTKVAELTNSLNIANLELANKEQQRLDALNDNKYYKNMCLELTEQLAEKEKEIEAINKEFIQSIKDWKSLVEKKNKDIVELEEHDKLFHNQLAIAELEKVKEFINKHIVPIVSVNYKRVAVANDLFDQIDQQIKELKGETNEQKA
jgi:hypothetical protein